ncbi:MAG TPA: hypothetical protein V6C69_04875 [Trichormus sp.]|jgi:hypothetical protein
MHRKTDRQNMGNTFIIITMIVCFFIVPLLMVVGQFGLYSVDRSRIENIVEAAGLVAANDLSRIVINDPYFGYVSLSNYAPIGKGTFAPDGEPLPVVGINTLIGTVRHNMLLAKAIGNETMYSLADNDRSYLDDTIGSLNKTLKNAVTDSSPERLLDIHGDKVDTVSDVKSFLTRNLPPNVRVESMRISTGWLNSGGTTTIDAPTDLQVGEIKSTDVQLGKYKPFINMPVAGRSFVFAGVGKSSALVPTAKFSEADDRHLCSIVKIDCVLLLNNRKFIPFGSDALSKIECAACSEPFSLEESGAGPVMTMRCFGTPLPALQSFRDCMNEGNFHDSMVSVYSAATGDYPIDAHSYMAELQFEAPPTTAQQFAEHLYYWLRSGHTRPRLEAVLAMINQNNNYTPGNIYAYEFSNNGTINRRILAKDPFPVGVTADEQFETIADTRVAGGYAPVIIFRDNVANAGTVYGGKHGGQPFPGDPLNWCDLADYSGSEETGAQLGKGKRGTGLAMLDQTGATTGAGASLKNLFQSIAGSALSNQPRRSYYSGGLGLDIEIGCVGPSTAMLDVQRMRQLKR